MLRHEVGSAENVDQGADDSAPREARMQVWDPVCGMTFDASEAAATVEYDGKTYYFCAPGCKESFEEDPERYVEGGNR